MPRHPVYGEEPPEVIVGAVEDVERVLLIWDDIHRFRIVLPGRCDMEECRYPGLNIYVPFYDSLAKINSNRCAHFILVIA